MSRKNHRKVIALQIPPFFSASLFWKVKGLRFSYSYLMTMHQAVAAVGEVEDMVDQMEKHVLCHGHYFHLFDEVQYHLLQ